MNNDEFKLDALDAAIVITKDMSVNMYLPKISDEETVNVDDNQNVFVIMAMMMSLDDPEFREWISKKIDMILAASDAMCTPPEGGCDGGCCGCGGE